MLGEDIVMALDFGYRWKSWHDAKWVLDRIGEMVAAGADHVAIIPLAADGTTERLPTLEALAGP